MIAARQNFRRRIAFVSCAIAILSTPLAALERPGFEYKIFQFPADQIPRIDGGAEDWSIVPESYVVGTDQLWCSVGRHDTIQPESLDVRVKVGWVEGLNRLYFLYEAYDDYWDFALPGLKNDTFEVVVDGDLSGGPLIARFRENPDKLAEEEAWWSMQGNHAQNYHIFTPARNKDWAMYWGPAQWLKELPYANYAYRYDFGPRESGKLTLEFWITPFDYAAAEGPERSVPSILREDKLIGLAWAIIDYDDEDSDRNNGFWNLARKHTMYGQASELVGFHLMPLEPELSPDLQCRWSIEWLRREDRSVQFRDESIGAVESWQWDFGDGQTSNEQHPRHQYAERGHYVVNLTVAGPNGESKYSRVWDVSF